MRYIPRWNEIELDKIEDIFSKAIPGLKQTRFSGKKPLSEMEIKKIIEDTAHDNNSESLCFLGGGAYDHYIPSVVWELAARREFLTSYTQYQPELSQGYLQALFEYQSMMAELLGMDVVNASMYDGASALAEAALMAARIKGDEKHRILVSGAINPLYKKVLETYLIKGLGLVIEYLPLKKDGTNDFSNIDILEEVNDVACVLVQNPNFYGIIENLNGVAEKIHNKGALLVMSVNPVSLGLLKSPGEFGADIAVGDLQPLGIPLGFGGPYAGFFSTKKEYLRQMPGRIVGATIDTEGKSAYALTIATREQHVKRYKATSNICSNQALCALAAGIYLATLGKEGLKEVARQCLAKTAYFVSEINKMKHFWLYYKAPFFNEVLIGTDVKMEVLKSQFARVSVIFPDSFLGVNNLMPSRTFLTAITEKRSKEEINFLINILRHIDVGAGKL